MTTETKNFAERIMDGENLTESDFDKHVGIWESGPQDRPVSEFLGLTRDEFTYICVTDHDFDVICQNIRLSRNEVVSGEVVQE